MLAKIPLSSSLVPIDKNSFLSTHPEPIATFESALAKYFNHSKKLVVLNSGTSAIHLALILAGVTKGDEVLCQSFTYIATINPILYQGATPIFIDSEPATWNMCPELLETAILDGIRLGKKPKAIIVVHIYGMPAKIVEIVAIAQKYHIVLIEDAAEALGSCYSGQPCGTFADYGILSFNSNKIITTFGGGALLCTTKEEKEKAIYLATQARDEAFHYQHSHVGYNYRMSPVLASIGVKELSKLTNYVSLRINMHQFYKGLFEGVKGITLFEEPSKSYFSNHWLSCILIDEKQTGFSSEALRLQLEKDNIESRPLWKPMHVQPLFKGCVYYGGTVAEDLFERGLCLPSGSLLSDADRERIGGSIRGLLK